MFATMGLSMLRFHRFALILCLACEVIAYQHMASCVSIPYCEADINYHAGNEFIAAHYGTIAGRDKYFPNDFEREPIYDARQGVWSSASGSLERAKLDKHGFTLLQAPTQAWDWTRPAHVRDVYLPELQDVMLQQFGTDNVERVVFWCPSLRVNSDPTPREEQQVQTPHAGYVATAHVDTDVNAYQNARDLVQLISRNCYTGTDCNVDDITMALEAGQRFAIVNTWRNVDTKNPVRRKPLAFMPMHYSNNKAFPHGDPKHVDNLWYSYPRITSEELLVFYQYDRDDRVVSDLWHCALPQVEDTPDAPDRKSFDLRCFVVLKEKVSEEHDRFAKVRRKASRLSQAESQQFCSEQAQRLAQS